MSPSDCSELANLSDQRKPADQQVIEQCVARSLVSDRDIRSDVRYMRQLATDIEALCNSLASTAATLHPLPQPPPVAPVENKVLAKVSERQQQKREDAAGSEEIEGKERQQDCRGEVFEGDGAYIDPWKAYKAEMKKKQGDADSSGESLFRLNIDMVTEMANVLRQRKEMNSDFRVRTSASN